MSLFEVLTAACLGGKPIAVAVVRVCVCLSSISVFLFTGISDAARKLTKSTKPQNHVGTSDYIHM